jgi:nitroreductase/NAD-dependent dihydropyrimidine dehydrogenase PreA subunit
VNSQRCTRCGLCATACPLDIIRGSVGETPVYTADGSTRCIICGHCVAVCQTNAIEVEDARLEPTSYEKGDSEIAPERLAAYLRMRRSIRNYRNTPVERTVIDRLMDVVRYAPSSSNSQAVRWLIVYNTLEVRRLAGLAVDWMRTVMVSDAPINAYFNFEWVIRAWDRGEDPICRKAPHLVVAYAHKDSLAAPTDAIIALSHLEIIAPSLGLGTCWGGFFQMALSRWEPLRTALDLPVDHVSIYTMMLGYPAFHYQRPPQRNPVTISWRS